MTQRPVAAVDLIEHRALLIVFASVEVGVGVLLVAWPAMLVELLFGTSLDNRARLIVGRVAGIALLSLVVACWIPRNSATGLAATGLIAGALSYNVGVVVLLSYAGATLGLTGIALWPAVLVHVPLAVWWCCAFSSESEKRDDRGE